MTGIYDNDAGMGLMSEMRDLTFNGFDVLLTRDLIS